MTKTLKTVQKEYGVRILIVLLSMLFLCTYISQKEGYHMDEILAFQLANAEYNPWIVPIQPVGRLAKFMEEHIDGETFGETVSNISYIIKDTLTNRGSSILANYKADVYDAPVWISKEAFQNYVRCNQKDDYNLFSVYFNVKDDNHPPLHFMLLHIMTSLFKGEINAWHGCSINLAAMAVTLWLIGLIGDIIFKKKTSSAAAMIMYGFSVGIVATTIWIRMYALVTMWTVWVLYLHLRKYTCIEQDSFMRIRAKDGKVKWIGSVGILAVTVMSFWTQYFGLFFILPLALVTTVLLIKERRIPELWAYIRTMVTAAAIGIVTFPFAIQDVLFSDRGTEALSQWQNGISEYMTRLKAFGDVLAVNVAADPIIFIILILVPSVVLLYQCTRKRYNSEMESAVVGMTVFPSAAYFLLAAKMSPYFVDRYIMAVFPMAVIIIIWLWDAFSDTDKPAVIKKYGCLTVAIAVSAVHIISMNWEHEYLYKGYEEQRDIAEAYADYPMVCLYVGSSFYENVMEMEHYEQTILVKAEELKDMDRQRTDVTQQGYVALIKYPVDGTGEAQLDRIMEVFGGSESKLLFSGGAFGDAVYLVTP